MDLWQKLIVFWQRCGLVVQPGVEAVDVQAFEAKYGVILPPDLRSYFEAANGSGVELTSDSAFCRFWPLEEVKLVEDQFPNLHPDRSAYSGYFHFADHSVWMNAYAVRLSQPSGPVISVAGAADTGRTIADSFTEFIEMYLSDPWSII